MDLLKKSSRSIFIYVFPLVFFFCQIGHAEQVLSSPSSSLEINRLPDISVRWRFQGENRQKNEWIKSVAWVWSYPYEYNLVASPMIRVEVSLPRGSKASEKMEFVPTMINPLKFIQSKDGTTIIADVSLFSLGANIEFDINHERAVLEIRILPNPESAYIAIHPSCAELGLTIDTPISQNMKYGSRPLAITCLHTEDGINLNIMHWADYN